MLDIERVDHVGIRVSDKARSIDFYESLGFQLVSDVGFEKGHPMILQHASGDVLNLLGPASSQSAGNILMDVADKYAGITHVSYKVTSIEAAKTFLASIDVALSGEFEFRGLQAIFIRDPDLNVIELDGYSGEQPDTRRAPDGNEQGGYHDHI